jgi:hypothetical protein
VEDNGKIRCHEAGRKLVHVLVEGIWLADARKQVARGVGGRLTTCSRHRNRVETSETQEQSRTNLGAAPETHV